VNELKKWIFIVLAVVLVVLIWQSVSVYRSAMAEKNNDADEARKLASEHYSIKQIKDVTFYHGKKDYHVVDAVLKNGRHVYIWVPEKASDQYLMLPVSGGYTKSEI